MKAFFVLWLSGVLGFASSVLWALRDDDFRADFMRDPPLFRWLTLPVCVLTWPIWVIYFACEEL